MTKKETWGKLRKLKEVFGTMPDGNWELGGLGAANEFGGRGFDLEGADFSGAYLGAADLSEAILNNANFSGAKLYEVKLSEAKLCGANFTGADLYKAELISTDLSDANLSNVDFLFANLSGADLSYTSIRESFLNEVNLNRARLSGADITGSTFWGVSTAGWIIDGIIAQHLYFCHNQTTDREKYRRDFQNGQFEALYKSLPTVELIFAGGLSTASLFTLGRLVEELNRQNQHFGLRMANIHKDEFETSIALKINNDDDLGSVGQLLQDAIDRVASEISVDVFTPYIAEILPEHLPNLLSKTSRNQSSSLIVNIIQPAFQFIKADGSAFSGPISQSGPTLNVENVIVKNYRAQRRTVDRLFLDLKKCFDEHEVSMKDVLKGSTDRMILAVQQGKDVSTIQNCWEEIKEGIKTGGAAATIAATIARMLGLV